MDTSKSCPPPFDRNASAEAGLPGQPRDGSLEASYWLQVASPVNSAYSSGLEPDLCSVPVAVTVFPF